MLKAVKTEKSNSLAKAGKYTFLVDVGMTKYEIKGLIEKTFAVKPKRVSTLMRRSTEKRTQRGRKKVIPAVKKVIVELSGKDKIQIFEDKKK